MLVRRKHHRPSKLAKKRRKILLFKIGGIVFVVALLVTGLIFALRAERINIVDIEIKGNSAIAAKTLKNFAEREISGNYLFVLPKSSIILYPKKGMEEAFLENFKEIKEVNISFESLQSISVNIQERKPYALYCSATTTDCYFLDEDGFIFTKAPDFSGNVFLRYFGAIEDGSIIGQQFLTKENFREINFFLSSLLEIGLNPISFSMLNDDDNERIDIWLELTS